jgi:hypothetical protein
LVTSQSRPGICALYDIYRGVGSQNTPGGLLRAGRTR